MKCLNINLPYSLSLVCLFLMAMNFEGLFVYFGLLALVILVMFNERINFRSFEFVLYLFLSILMAFYEVGSGIGTLLMCAAYSGCFLIGASLISQPKRSEALPRAESFIKSIIVCLALGSFIHYALNFSLAIGSSSARNTVDIWTGGVLAATGQATLCVLMAACCCCYLMYATKKNQRVIALAILIVIMAYNAILAGRSLFLIIAITLFVGFVFLAVNQVDILKPVAVFAVIVVLAFLALTFDVMGIQTWLMNSNLGNRLAEMQGSLLETERTETKMLFLMHFFDYPFGGAHLSDRYGGYAHDLLLDAYDVYGILALAVLIGIIVCAIKNLWVCVSSKSLSFDVRILLVCVYTVLFAQFCLEPILAGAPWLFACFCVLNGCLRGLRSEIAREEKMQLEH